jgi:hypothetical protein
MDADASDEGDYDEYTDEDEYRYVRVFSVVSPC